MRITLKKIEAGSSYVRVRQASGRYEEVITINHYKVYGFPDGHETSIELRGGRHNRQWEIFKESGYSGFYPTANEALDALQNSIRS